MENICRLRIDEKIVGYKKEMGNFSFFSKDLYGWSGTKIDFIYQDQYSGFKDKHDRKLFAEDIVSLTVYPEDYFILMFDSVINKFYLINYKTSTIFEEDIELIFSEKNKITRVAFTFEQKEM